MLKDYESTIEYHLGKANVVADALSKKFNSSLSHISVTLLSLFIELKSLAVDIALEDSRSLLATLCVRLVLIKHIDDAQGQDPQLIKIIEEVKIGT